MLPYAINFSEPQIRNLSKEKQQRRACYKTHSLVGKKIHPIVYVHVEKTEVCLFQMQEREI